MSFYPILARNPQQFLSCSGMPLPLFEHYLPQFEAAFRSCDEKRKARVVRTGNARMRARGGGGQFEHPLADRLLMLLLYYRLYVTPDFLTLLFSGCDKSTICRTIAAMRPVFEAVLPTPERQRRKILALARAEQERRKRISSIAEFIETYPELTFLIDGTEQPKRRPQDPNKQKDDYSGKKKRHTRKQLLTTTPSGHIVDQSPSTGGRTHDFTLLKDDKTNRPVFSDYADVRATFYADSGFQGMADLALPVTVRLIDRARRNHPLTTYQKQINHLRAHIRIPVEHTIAARKKYRIAAEVYRNKDEQYDQDMNIVAGLVNLRASDRLFQKTGLNL